jgi:RNA polymerase I-specific transcription initiation factor RRN7
LLRIDDFRATASDTIIMYSDTFGVSSPPLNHQSILMDYIETLALPLQTYSTVNHINTILAFNFSYPGSSSRRTMLSYPEVQLATLLVVATKLLFPLEPSIKPIPRSLNDPGALKMNWNAWMAAKADCYAAMSSSAESIRPGTHMALKDVDILDMSDGQLDEYMDWYQDMWMSPERKEEGVQKKILELFPVKEMRDLRREEWSAKMQADEEQIRNLKRERLLTVMRSLKARRAVSDDQEQELIEQGELERNLLRPGMRYEIYRDISDLEGAAKVFHEEAAHMIGITVEGLLKAIRSVENNLEKWRREKRRQELYGVTASKDVAMDDEMEVEMDGALAL